MLMRGGFLLYLVFIITAAESRSNVIDIHVESEEFNQGGANQKSTECQCEKMGGYCIENGDHCNGIIEILHNSGDDQCCCCLPKPRESTECQCEKMGGYCIENGDHCNGTIEILHNFGDDQCCCCIPKPRETTHDKCKKMDGFCVESGDICTGIMEILYNSYDDHCCCCISFTPDEYGICTVWGDPHFITSANGGVELKYDIMAAGNFPLTKYEKGSSPIFEVTSTFYNCGTDHIGRPISCIEDVTYYEDGKKKIKLSLRAPPGRITIMEPVGAHPNSGTIGLVTYNLVHYFIELPGGGSGNYPCMHVDGSKGIKVIFCYVAGNYGIIDILYKFNPSLKNLPGLCDWRDSRTEDFAESWKIRSARDTVGEVEPIVPKSKSNIVGRCTVDSELEEVNRRCDKSMPHDAFKFLPAWDYNVYREACTFDLCHLSNNTGYEEGYAVHMGILGQLFYNVKPVE